MARLRYDYLLLRRGDRAEPRRAVRPIVAFLIFLSLSLLLLSRLHHSQIADLRWRVASFFAPLLQAATVPTAPIREFAGAISSQIDMTAELERLRTENQKLSGWDWRAQQLEAKLADLEAQMKVVPQQGFEFVTSRVIADSSGAFARSVMIDSGEKQRVKPGYPVVNADGLVGRVVDVGPNSARVLIASDLNSRIPVSVGASGVRAILAGDNEPEPRLLYLPEGAEVRVGDAVGTSGIGGLFPAGLRIGVVSDTAGTPRVALRAHLDRLSYVSVLLFDDPARALAEDLRGEVKAEQERRPKPSANAATEKVR